MHYRYQSKESYNQYDKLKSKQIKPRIVLKKRIMPDSLKRIFVFLSLNSRQIVGKQVRSKKRKTKKHRMTTRQNQILLLVFIRCLGSPIVSAPLTRYKVFVI